MITGKILVTGGAGTIGNAIIERAKRDSWDCDFTIYSRSESRQAEMRRAHPRLNYVIGDVRDSERLTAVTAGHDVIIHAAAMKRIPECETNPIECIKTNVNGTLNVAKACIANGIDRAIFTSSDKAVNPKNIYGATKLCGEHLWIKSNIGSHRSKFSIARYGNVAASQGSVIERWAKQLDDKRPITITDNTMITGFDFTIMVLQLFEVLMFDRNHAAP